MMLNIFLERMKADADQAQARLTRMYNAGHHDERAGRGPMKCKNCGEEFVHSDARRKACSTTCSNALRGKALSSARWQEGYK